jgi:hypothetical protein
MSESDETTPARDVPQEPSATGADPNAEAAAIRATPPAPTHRKRRRRFIRVAAVLGILLLLLLLLIALAPTLAGTAPVRSFALGKVNQNLHGKIEVDDLSLGWLSGAKVNGLRVLDASGQPILKLASLTTDLSLLDVIRGNYSLGEAVVDGLEFQARRDADGEINFSKLAKTRPEKQPKESEPQPQPETPEAGKPAAKLPNVSGHFVIRNSKGSYADAVSGQSVQFPSIDGDVRIPDINSPIENALTVVAVPANGQAGTLKIRGSADVVDDNELHPQSANVNETVALQGLAMATVAAFLPPASFDRLEGVTNAELSLQMTAGQSGVLKGQVVTSNLAAGGPALKGDTFATPELSLIIPPTTIEMSSGFGAWQNWPIRTGGTPQTQSHPQPIVLRVKHKGYDDTVTLGVAATPAALTNLAGNLKPGSNGEIALAVNVNLGGLAKQLPHSFPETEGTRLSSGALKQSVQVTLGPDAAQIVQTLDLTDLAIASADGKTDKLQDIKQELRFSTLGGGWAMPEMRDLHLGLTSGFAQADFGGKELTQLKGTATGDLAKAQRELGQLLPMQGLTLGGTFKVNLTSSGDVASATAPIEIALVATVAGLQLDGVGGMEQLRQGHTQLEAHAQVVRGAAGIEALNGVRVIAQSGKGPQNLTLDSQLSADVRYVPSTQTNAATGKTEKVRVAQVPKYTIDKVNVDLPAAQRDFPTAFASLGEQGVRLDAGALTLAGSGSYSVDATSFDVKGGITGLTLTRFPPPTATASATVAPVPPAPAPTTVLSDYTLSLDAAGSNSKSGTRVTRLNVEDNQKMLSLRKGQADLLLPTDKALRPSGEVALGADLKKLVDLSRAMSGAAPPAPDGPELQSGRLDGTLRLADSPGPDKLLALSGKMDLTGVTVRTAGQPIRDEKLSLVMGIRSTPDFGVLNIDHVTIDGRLVKGRVFDTVVDRAAGNAPNAGPLAAVRKANAVLDVPALADLHALILAISPPAQPATPKTAKAAKPAVAAKPVPQGRILAGSANAKLTLGHQGNHVTITPDITVKGLALGAGDVSKNVGDVVIRTAIQLAAADNAPADATVMQRLRELTVPNLTLTGAGADVKLDRPLVMKDPGSSNPSMSAALIGKINLEQLLSTLEAWQGAKSATLYPYHGDMTLRQELSTAAGGAIALVGRADVTNFATLGDTGPRFAEPKVSAANNIVLDSAAKQLTLNDLSFSTDTTHAVHMVATGIIHEFDTARRLDNVVVKLDYDAAALWNILKPLMDPESGGKSLDEFTMTGKRLEQITLSGSYPADDPKAIQSLHMEGGFALETLAGRGLTVAGLDLRFLLDKGILKLEHVGQPVAANAAPTTTPTDVVARGGGEPAPASLPPGARCNGSGLISFHGFTVDLTGEHPRLNTPDNHPLIYHVSINPVVANTLLAKFVNPAFSGSEQAKGMIDVTVVSCKNLALDKAMQMPNASESGRAEIRYSLTDLMIGQPELFELISKLKPNALNAGGFTGNVRDGHVILERGQVQSAMTFNAAGEFNFKFDGTIGLAENSPKRFFATLPPEMFSAINKDFGKNVPKEGYRIAITGKSDDWVRNVSDSIAPMLADLGVRAGLGSVLDRALGGTKNKDREATDNGQRGAAPGPQPNAQPATPEDALGQLLDRALGGGKDKETEAEKKARRARAAEEKAAAATQPSAKKEKQKKKK